MKLTFPHHPNRRQSFRKIDYRIARKKPRFHDGLLQTDETLHKLLFGTFGNYLQINS